MKEEKQEDEGMEDLKNGYPDDVLLNGGIGDMPAQNTNKRVLVLLIVDATKSMIGQGIGQVNYGIQELFSELRGYASSNPVNLEIGILSFTDSIDWEMKPQNIQTCVDPVHIEIRPGLTRYGVVYNALEKMLTKEDLLKCQGKQAAPVLVFMTDGAPTDEYQSDLDKLRKNGYFALSNRSAVIMGKGANNPEAIRAVKEFVSDPAMVLTAGEYSKIAQSIKLATLKLLENNPQGKEQLKPAGNIFCEEPSQTTPPGPSGENVSGPDSGPFA